MKLNVPDELRRLSKMTLPELRAEYSAACGEEARSNNRAFLIKRIAWRKQAAAFGGLSERARQRAAEIVRETDLRMRPTAEVHSAYAGLVVSPQRAGMPPVGTVLTRVYRGRRITATVVANGAECEGKVYPSLTALAKAITGAAWNGRLFFGLTSRGDKA